MIKCNFCYKQLNKIISYHTKDAVRGELDCEVLACKDHVWFTYENRELIYYEYQIEYKNNIHRIYSSKYNNATELAALRIQYKSRVPSAPDTYETIIAIPRFIPLQTDKNNIIDSISTFQKLKTLLPFS